MIYFSAIIFLIINICSETSGMILKANILKGCLSNDQQDSSRGPERVTLGLEDSVTKEATFH